MRRFLRSIFGQVEPVTHLTVEPAERDHHKEEIIRQHRAQTAKAVVDAERSSWEIRQRLAGNVLSIVSGDRA